MIPPVEKSWTNTQKSILAITPKISSFLSIIGSSYIIYHCLELDFSDSSERRTENNMIGGNNTRGFRSSMYTRILMALSFCDLVSSSAWFLSTWPIPMDDNQGMSVYNIGTYYTCNAQGYMLLAGTFGGACYNTCLSVYFCLLVRSKVDKRRNNHNNNRKKLEFIFHFVSLTFPLSTAMYGVFKGYMNPTPSNCFISEYPRGCIGDECIRGQYYKKFRVYSTLLPLVVCFLVITISMVLLYRSVKKLERQTLMKSSIVLDSAALERKKTSDNEEKNEDVDDDEEQVQSDAINEGSNSNKKAILTSQANEKIFRLAILYVAALFTCWFPIIFRTIFTKFFVDDPTTTFVSGLLNQILSPLQGAFNSMIYRGFNPLTFLCRILFYPCSSLLHNKRSKNETNNQQNIKETNNAKKSHEYLMSLKSNVNMSVNLMMVKTDRIL